MNIIIKTIILFILYSILFTKHSYSNEDIKITSPSNTTSNQDIKIPSTKKDTSTNNKKLQNSFNKYGFIFTPSLGITHNLTYVNSSSNYIYFYPNQITYIKSNNIIKDYDILPKLKFDISYIFKNNAEVGLGSGINFINLYSVSNTFYPFMPLKQKSYSLESTNSQDGYNELDNIINPSLTIPTYITFKYNISSNKFSISPFINIGFYTSFLNNLSSTNSSYSNIYKSNTEPNKATFGFYNSIGLSFSYNRIIFSIEYETFQVNGSDLENNYFIPVSSSNFQKPHLLYYQKHNFIDQISFTIGYRI